MNFQLVNPGPAWGTELVQATRSFSPIDEHQLTQLGYTVGNEGEDTIHVQWQLCPVLEWKDRLGMSELHFAWEVRTLVRSEKTLLDLRFERSVEDEHGIEVSYGPNDLKGVNWKTEVFERLDPQKLMAQKLTMILVGALDERLIHGGGPAPEFSVIEGYRVQVDSDTGTMWQVDVSDLMYDATNAERYCDRLEYAGFDDWDLPSEKQLLTLVRSKEQHGYYWEPGKWLECQLWGRGLDQKAQCARWWTSDFRKAWVAVDFSKGESVELSRTVSNHSTEPNVASVRCVRDLTPDPPKAPLDSPLPSEGAPEASTDSE